MNIKVLVAEDDKVFRKLVCDILKKQGYECIEASNGKEAIDKYFENKDIDLIILDVMMPIYDGWEVLKEIRKSSDVKIMMLTALMDEKDEVFGLEKGADDYISKPFSYQVFIARVNTILRKVKKDKSCEIKIEDITINQETFKVSINDTEIKLNRKEYDLLLYLIKNKNITLSREQILDRVWGFDFDKDERTIDTHIKTLRAKLLHCGKYIKTVRGRGYAFEVNNNENN